MGFIVCLMGKSASGKDTVYRRLLESDKWGFSQVIPYTTRPMREGEQDGREYRFISDEELAAFEKAGKVIEVRRYDTVYGVWSYATIDDGSFSDGGNVLAIGTLEAYNALCRYFGKDRLIPVYIEVEDGLRLSRALAREQQRDVPGYAEMCRRFLSDAQDFSEENIEAAGITKRFDNTDLESCLEEIDLYLSGLL